MMKERIFVHETGRQGIKKRLLITGFCLLIGFVIVIARSYQLQVRPQKKLGRLALQQYQKKVPETIGRGSIYDRHGEELAVSVPSYSLGVHPRQVKEQEELARFASADLSLPKKAILASLSSSSKFVWLKRHLSAKETAHFQDLPTKGESPKGSSLNGLQLVKESKRFYPNKELASPLIGAVGYDNRGLSGLELYYDKTLRGTPTHEVAYRDARGEIFGTEEGLEQTPGLQQQKAHLVLTVDRQLQFITERELQMTASRLKAKGGSAIVMDPTNGAILAMASYPSFNPNSYTSYDLSLWKNKSVAEMFEPGSTFKTIVAAAALEDNLVQATDKFFCENGSFRIGKNTIHDHDPYGTLTFLDILKVSSNIGIYKIQQKVGRARFYEIIRNFGFGDKTDIDYPGEISGRVLPVSRWSEIDTASISFGQGVGVTALQMTNAFATIASGGLRWRPYLVQKIVDEQGKVLKEASPRIVKRVLREETAHRLTQILKTVVSEEGTGKLASLPGYTIAGKTGTAQKLDPKTKRYSHSKYLSSFVGYFPADSPRLVIFVAIDEPVGITYGGQVAAPIFRNIALAAVQKLGIHPEKTVQQVATQSKEPVGTGPAGPSPTHPKSAVSAEVAASAMPDLRGLSMRQAISLLEGRGMKIELRGTGVAVGQSLAPGTAIKEGALCQVFFQPE
ncbi:MAG: penicillin-binding protein [Deltaproteobacteria bacterium]|nr:penicillin-binding protein [Deltaproteobacteria bacterium]